MAWTQTLCTEHNGSDVTAPKERGKPDILEEGKVQQVKQIDWELRVSWNIGALVRCLLP